MKKPTLRDYGLSDELLKKYNSQKAKGKEKLEEYLQERKGIRNWIGIITIIIGIITLIVAAINGFEDASAIPASIWFPWAITFGCYYLNTFHESAIDINYEKREKIESSAVDPALLKKVQNYNAARKEYENWQRQCEQDYWTKMSGYEFEKAIAELYEKQGYDVQRTKYSGDGGVDVILTKNGTRIAVQCKHHAKPVGPNDVRALMGVVASQNFNSGIFVSISGFTYSVHSEIERSKISIELISLREILSMVKGDIGTDSSCHSAQRDKPVAVTNGTVVYHKIFGKGCVKEISSDYLIIQFGKDEKRFSNPSLLFQVGFLSMFPLQTTKSEHSSPETDETEDKTEIHKRICTGNCSTCNRDTCIEDL